MTSMAMLCLEHGNSQGAELFGLRLDGEARHPGQEARGIDEPGKEPGGMPEERRFLLQVDVDSAEEDTLLAHIHFIRADGGVGGNEERVMSLSGQGSHQGIVVQATAAIHAGGACGDVGDAHVLTVSARREWFLFQGAWAENKEDKKRLAIRCRIVSRHSGKASC